MGFHMMLSRTSSPDGQDNLDKIIYFEKDHLKVIAVLDSLKNSSPNFLNEFEDYIYIESDNINLDDLRSAIQTIVKSSLNSCTNLGKASISIALISGKKAVIGHAGDCRAYLPNHNFITRDHSAVQKNFGKKNLSHEAFSAHPLKDWSYPMRTDDDYTFEVSNVFSLDKGDTIILCTDGWWRNNNHDSIIGLNIDTFEESIQTAQEFHVCQDDFSVILYTQD